MNAILTLILLITTSSISFGQGLGREKAEAILKETLRKKKLHNVIDGKTEIIKDQNQAVKLAETYLFDMYGENQITKQRPYEIYKIGQYWTILGRLPLGYQFGGTFVIILDATDSRVLRITHGK